MAYHYEGDDLIVRKIRVGEMENNVYVLECPETRDALLVDACFEPDQILSAAQGANIVGIVQTHAHFDHIQALPALKEKLGVPVYAQPGEDYPVPIARELTDGDSIPFGKRNVTVLSTPGHTPAGICLYAPGHLVSGDTLFPGGPGNTWGNPDAFAQIIAAIENKLFVLPGATAVYPGHGEDTTIAAEKPHLQEWKERGW